MKRSILPALATIFLLILSAAPGPGSGAAHAQRFGEEISIIEVEIPVHVLRGGDPVGGLTVDDFEVFDDGEPREIVGFRVIDLSRVERIEEEAPGRPAPDGAPSPALGPEGRRILLLFDFLFSRPHYLERSLLGAQEMVASQLHPEDRVAVAYLTGGGANIVLGFSRDREELDAALGVVGALLDRKPASVRENLERLARVQGLGDEPVPESRGEPRTQAAVLTERFGAVATVAMLGGAETIPSSGGAPGFGTGISVGEATFNDGDSSGPVAGLVSATDPFALGESLASASETSAIRTLAQEIGQMATLLRDVPGQKQMLYLSEGFSSSIINGFASGQRALVMRHLETMFEALRRGGWTLHAMDVEGVPDAFAGRGFDADALFYMANETGGLLFENYNRLHQATEKLVKRTSVTYVLTIRSDELPADGHLHRLDVRLKDKQRGTRVLHRTGYYAPKPSASKSALERQLDTVDLLLGKRVIEELGARVLAGTLPPADGLVPVPVVVEIPAGHLLDGAAAGVLALEIQLYAVDAREGVQDLWLRNLRLDLGTVGDRVARGGIRVLGGLALPPGEYRLRTLVRAPAADRVSLATTPLSVAADGGGLLPLPPVVIDRTGDWLELVALPAGPGGASGDALAMGPTHVVPPVAPEVRSGGWLEFLVVTVGGEMVELSGRLLDVEGGEVAAGGAVEFVDRLGAEDPRLTRHLGRAVIAELAPGRYRLEVSASGPGDAEPASRSLAFEVVE